MPSRAVLERAYEQQCLTYQYCKRDLGLYVQEAWPVLEPTTPLIWGWHHDYIAEHLEATAASEITRLIINVYPRSTKSTITSVCFPTWLWILDPATRFLFGSHKKDLATSLSMKRRNLLESPWYQQGYGHRFKLSTDENTKSRFTNNCTGAMICSGMKNTPIGEGGDYVLIDDPHDPKGSNSQVDRERVCEEFDLGWSQRLNDKKKGRIIVIMQRLHEMDLTGHILAKRLGYVHVRLPSVAEERERRVFPVTGRIVTREQGEFLHHARMTQETLDNDAKVMGPYGYSGQHQQSPTPKTGGVFKTDMFMEVEELPKGENGASGLTYTFITADTAYSEKKENDFTVFSAWGVRKTGPDPELYLIDVYRKQIAADKVEIDVKPFLSRFAKWGFRGAWIEPKGHGIYLNGALPKVGVMIPREDTRNEFFSDRKLDKVERANNAVPHLASRKIRILKACNQREEILAEALRFPKGAHDDFVDTLIDAIKFVFARRPGSLDMPI